MPISATVINLLPPSDTDESALRTALGVDEIVFVPGREIRERGASEGLKYLRKIFRDSKSTVIAIHTPDWARQSRRTELYGLACLMPTRRRIAVDPKGQITPLTWPDMIFTELTWALWQKIAGRRLLLKTDSVITENLAEERIYRTVEAGSIHNILYMRTDLWFGVKAGGSIGHVAGVIGGFEKTGADVHVLSWECPELISPAIGVTRIPPDNFYINERELSLLSYNNRLISGAKVLFQEFKADAVYARYALDCWAPVAIAELAEVPLIIEYNGSEVWIHKNWGQGIKYPGIAQKIEDWVLKSAELITVVSTPLKDELVKKGYNEKRILVNPNCVDPDRFDPGKFSEIEIADLKKKLGIPVGAIVGGFIGTFSPWHGVEDLAEAIPLALSECPQLHFLLIGSGPLFDSVVDRLRSAGVLDSVTFTGIVPQDEAPKYLMCSDFFLSPHVPNADGTPFFGSPTKLFEYMALGKGIIASDLDQLAEILRDEETALLVPPADVSALASAVERLYRERDLSDRLGKAARELAMREYTWEAHVKRILERLYLLK